MHDYEINAAWRKARNARSRAYKRAYKAMNAAIKRAWEFFSNDHTDVGIAARNNAIQRAGTEANEAIALANLAYADWWEATNAQASPFLQQEVMRYYKPLYSAAEIRAGMKG